MKRTRSFRISTGFAAALLIALLAVPAFEPAAAHHKTEHGKKGGPIECIDDVAPATEHSIEMVNVAAPDGPTIALTVFRPAGASVCEPVPMVLHSSGFGGVRWKNLDDFWEIGPNGDQHGAVVHVRTLLDAGFGVVSLDHRGHGDSQGLNDVFGKPERLGVLRVIDHIAGLPWAQKDGPGDPRLGMIGGSGGAAAQVLVALEETERDGRTRIDSLLPIVAYWDLFDGLAPSNVPRSFWLDVFRAAVPTGKVRMEPEAVRMNDYARVMGEMPNGQLGFPDFAPYAAERSPRAFVERGIKIDIPVLIGGAALEGLFPLEHQYALFEQALTEKAQQESAFFGLYVFHTLFSLTPFRESCAREDPTFWLTWLQHTLKDANTTFGPRVRLSSGDGTCHKMDSLPRQSRIANGPAVPLPVTIGTGGPLLVPLGTGPELFMGLPTLDVTITSAAAKGVLFVALGMGPQDGLDRTGYSFIMSDQWTPIRFGLGTTTLVDFPLAGVADFARPGETVWLVIEPTNPDQFYWSGSRTPAGAVLEGISVNLPSFTEPA